MKINWKIMRVVALGLTFLLSINSFATSISENDGSAFISKSEFDALRSSFQAQIDTYNQNIDSKIDSAIASYLAGIKVSKEIPLYLDAKNHYVFPLRYDLDENWNNADTGWFALARPEFKTKLMYLTTYMGMACPTASSQGRWKMIDSDRNDGVITLASPSNTEMDPNYQWSTTANEEQQISVTGINGLILNVERDTSTRTINLGAGPMECQTYAIKQMGTGTQKIVNDNFVDFGYFLSNQGHIREQATRHCYTYHNFVLCRANIYSSTITSSTDVWTPTNLVAQQAGYYANLRHILANEYLSLSQIKSRGGMNSPFSQPMTILSENSVQVYKALDYINNDMQFVFGHGANVPANMLGHWKYGGKVNTSPSFVQFFSMTDNLPIYLSAWAWTWSRTVTQASLTKCHSYFMPRLYAPDNDTYDCSDTDDFSKLPSPLVTYYDSDGKKHYIDEGMFLGNMKTKGDVSFKIQFQKDAGSGTKVMLHISKKPFSYNFNVTDLINYKLNNTQDSGTEQQLNYDTEYTVTISDIEIGDQLYMEWLPLTSGDMSALTSFSDYKCVVNE